MLSVKHSWRMAALAAATALALAACGGGNQSGAGAQQGGGQQQPPQPVVSVVTVQPQTVTLENDLPGRLEAVRSAQIVPQVNGIVKRRLFTEGTFVKAGQPLYQLEDASYAASMETARASLLQAQATLAKAGADVARYAPLVQADAISKQEWDAAVAAKRSAEASVKAAQAQIRAAQVNLNHARITAPISGFIGESLVTEGALVTANSTKMALIQQNNPLYVNIKQTAAEVLKLRRQLAQGERVVNEGVAVSIILEDGSEYEHKGRLLFLDGSTVDESTGQLSLRAEVPNPDLILMSGLYVRVRLPMSSVDNAFVVPQRAVTRGQKNMVTLVKADGSMEQREVKITGQQGSNWVVSEGLKAGDKVVVDGTMIAGMLQAKTVKTKEWTPPTNQAASAPAKAVDNRPAAASASSALSAKQPESRSASAVEAASAAKSK